MRNSYYRTRGAVNAKALEESRKFTDQPPRLYSEGVSGKVIFEISNGKLVAVFAVADNDTQAAALLQHLEDVAAAQTKLAAR